MSKFIDLTGQKFGRLTVIDRASINKHGKPAWNCICDCGMSAVVLGRNLKGGYTRSCGCLHKEVMSKHGMHGTRTYDTWRSMIQRCINTRCPVYDHYGGRGIKVCDRWLNFKNFYEDMGVRPEGTSIERVDVNGNYEPGKCIWATPKEQSANRRNNNEIAYDGMIKCLKGWCEYLSMHESTFRNRMGRGWSVKQIIETPVRKIKKC